MICLASPSSEGGGWTTVPLSSRRENNSYNMSAKQVSTHSDVFISIPYYLLIKVRIKSCDPNCIVLITSLFYKGDMFYPNSITKR